MHLFPINYIFFKMLKSISCVICCQRACWRSMKEWKRNAATNLGALIGKIWWHENINIIVPEIAKFIHSMRQNISKIHLIHLPKHQKMQETAIQIWKQKVRFWHFNLPFRWRLFQFIRNINGTNRLHLFHDKRPAK